MPPYIKAESCYVSGVNTLERLNHLKDWFLHKGRSFRSEVVPILKNINFECVQGERIAFLGRNGSGKSSLLKMIAGIYPVESGSIVTRGSMATIIEMCTGLEYEMTGRQNIKILLLYNNMFDHYSEELERKIIEFSELGEKIDFPVKVYSTGMIARLGFSVVAFQNADILILDEVFATGDSAFFEKSLKLLEEKISITPIVLMVTHQIDSIIKYCNRCILLQNGSIIADDKPQYVKKLYEDQFHN